MNPVHHEIGAARESVLLPASQELAEVEHLAQHTDRVRLPPRFAKAALELYAHRVDPAARVIYGPAEHIGLGVTLSINEWALEVARPALPHLGLGVTSRSLTAGPRALLVFDRDTLFIRRPYTQYIQRAIEKVKPEELDPDGRPQPWIPARAVLAHENRPEREQDAELVEDSASLPREQLADAAFPQAPLEEGRTRHGGDTDLANSIPRWLVTLSRTAGLDAVPELVVVRGHEDHHGFVTGRVWFTREGRPRRIKVTTCPNSDLAEVLATLMHELAHPLAKTSRHDDAMKHALVGLASKQFGARFFAHPTAVCARERMSTVDAWVATGVRAALRGAEPPVDKSGDEGQVARAMGRLRKLRQLAKDQRGKPEGIAATAAGNDLTTLYGLGHYGAAAVGDHEADDRVVDRFVVLPDGAVWRRMLAHEVAAYFDVFALSLVAAGRMHFFGQEADVVAAEYLFSVSARRIERELEAHVAAWKKKKGKTTSAETRREKTSFCDSAAIAFGKKLSAYRDGDDTRGLAPRLERAEQVARTEHSRRGSGWGAAGSKTYRENEAGKAVGASMEVLRGVGGEAPARLPRKT